MKYLIILILVFVSFIGKTQTLTYDLFAKDHHIGELTVTKTEKENICKIEVLSIVSVHLFIKIELSYKLVSIYKNNELESGSVVVFVNGKEHSKTTVEKTGDFYTLTDGKHSKKLFDIITYSGARFYFTEPANINHLFSEFSNNVKPIKEIGENEYQVTDPEKGYKSEYIYKDGILQKSVIHHTLLTFKMEKQ